MLFILLLIAIVLVGGGWWYATRPPSVPVAPQVVAAVMTASAVRGDLALAERIEAAMSAAVHECLAAGVSMDDTATIHAAMQAARARVIGGA